MIVRTGTMVAALFTLLTGVAQSQGAARVSAIGEGHLTSNVVSGELSARRAPQTGTIVGQVVEARTQRPLAGVQVSVAGTGLGTLTNTAGRFQLLAVPSGEVTLRAQVIGYTTLDQTVTVVAGQIVTLDFQLMEQAINLDELVVTGTAGTARRREVGNSVAQLSAAEIAAAPARNPQDLLTGRATGVTVLQNAGQPGAGGTIRLRGTNSISQGNDPLIYIDGIRVYSGQSALHPSARQATSPLNDIDPNDIERVEVIKGAAATTLYGTEASNGVVQIFTKRGLPGQAQWDAQITTGINNIGRIGPSSDPTGMWVRRCRGSGNVMADGTIFEDPTCPASGSWLENGLVQRYSISVRGGQERISYYLSGNFSDEESPIYRGGGTANGGLTGNFTFQPADPIEITLNTNYSRRSTDWLAAGDNANAFMLNVSRGSGSNFGGAVGCSSASVVCIANGDLLDARNQTRGEHFVSGLTIRHLYGENLVNRLTVGYDYNTALIEEIYPFGYRRTPLGAMNSRDWSQRMISFDYVGSFSNAFGTSFESTLSWGGQLFANDGKTTTARGEDFAGPGKPTLTAAARTQITGDSRERVVNAGFFLQEMVGWRDKLFITAGLRVDGNSAFGRSFGLQPYPKLSASYVISEEEFWPFEWMESLKLRAAVGESGMAPGAFDAVRTWNPVAGDDGQPAFSPGQLGNPDLGPERSREIEVGFDAGLLDSRIALEANYFFQRTYDALIPVSYPPSQGFLNRQLENVGTLQNSGIELGLDAAIIRAPNLEWRARGTYSTAKSEAVDLGGEVITVQTFGRTFIQEGYPVPAIFGAKVVNPDEIADPIYEDDAFIGTLYPDKNISLSSSLTLYNNLTLDLLGEFVLGGKMVNANGYQNSRRGAWHQCYDIQAKMRAEASDPAALNDVTALERAKCALTGGRFTPTYDAWIESTDFFKLRNITLSYRLPQGWVPGTRSATLRLSGRNLFTVTDYTGTDPEVDDYRTSLARREYYVVPPYRTFQASLQIGF